jgi:hypothetical protein
MVIADTVGTSGRDTSIVSATAGKQWADAPPIRGHAQERGSDAAARVACQARTGA